MVSVRTRYTCVRSLLKTARTRVSYIYMFVCVCVHVCMCVCICLYMYVYVYVYVCVYIYKYIWQPMVTNITKTTLYTQMCYVSLLFFYFFFSFFLQFISMFLLPVYVAAPGTCYDTYQIYFMDKFSLRRNADPQLRSCM